MRNRIAANVVISLFLAVSTGMAASAQRAIRIGAASPANQIPSRIVDKVDETRLVALTGNTHPMARAEFDQGTVDPQLPLERMVMVLKRSPEQEAALQAFMTEQLDPKSPNFHHWLDSKEFGELYGASDADIAAISSWLQSHGFRVDDVTNGRTFLHFSGNAAQVSEAFHTEIHRYNVRGEEHISNNADPSIPAALAPVVVGIKSLNDFFSKPAHINAGTFRRDSKTGKWSPVEGNSIAKPSYVVSGGNGNLAFEEVSPYDFATIYNVLPLWNAGIDGTGVTVAIAGRSNIELSDVATFRSAFGLPANVPTVTVNGTDPGLSSADDRGENTLDVEWSGAVAKGAKINLVTTASTSTTDGAAESAVYIIDASPKIASIMSFSYQSCELNEGSAGNSYENSLWQQAAAEGITAFVASGDYAAAQCDGGQTGPYEATHGLLVSGLSSTPYDTAVGGTDLNWANSSGTYWSTTNASNGLSALGYMPEVPWNQTCASDAVDEFIGTTSFGWDAETTCQQLIAQNVDTFLVNSVGGSGGKSSCINPTGNTPASCTGGYPKPSWQTGTGVPNDGARDVPDLSLFASANGLNSGYLYCDTGNGPCDFTVANDAEAQVIGGTSVASPSMAGIMALVLQKQSGAAQGLANPVFYKLAAKDTLANCASNTEAAGNACNFNDITTDNNAVPCSPGSVDCTVIHTGDTVGIMTGWTSNTGFDLTTGLGSVNATNLVNNWSSASGSPTITLSPAAVTFPSTTVGTTSATVVTVTIKNTGTAAASLSTIEITGTDATSYTIASSGATACTGTLAVGASCAVEISFTPAAVGTLTATLSVLDNAGTGTQTATITGTGASAAATLTVSVSPTALAFGSTAVGSTNATVGVVTVKNTGTGTVTLTSETVAGANASSFVKSSTTCGATLAAGATCTVSVQFKPAAAGALSASLSIADNATGSPQTVALTGTGTAASTFTVSLAPTALAFGSTTVGSTNATVGVVTVKNTGTGTVTLTSETVAGANASSFVKSSTTCGATLAAGATCTVSVQFKPAAAGALSASLAIADNATGSPQTVALSGTGTAASSIALSVTPTSIAFPTTVVGATSAAQVVTLKNTGSATATFSTTTFIGADPTSFTETATTCGATLAAGASCTVSVAFKPLSAIAETASLSVSDNAAGSPQTVALTGTGAAAAAPALTLTPTSIAFPNTVAGTASDAQIVTLKNTGAATLTLTSIALTGSNTTSFAQIGTCGATLAASATCQLYVAFTPNAAAALTATIAITDNASGSPQKVTLTGTGTAAPSVKLSVATIAFPTTTHGTTSAAVPVTLTNAGTATLDLTSIALAGTNPTDFEALSTCATTLAPAASCTVYVAFKPATAAAFSAKLTVTDNGSASPQSVALSGTGK